MKFRWVRSVFVVVAVTIAGVATAQQTDSSRSVDAVGLATESRLVEWSMRADAQWDEITSPDADGLVTITNLRIQFGEILPEISPLALEIPELKLSETGDGFSGKVERIWFGVTRSMDLGYDLAGGTIQLNDVEGDIRIRADAMSISYRSNPDIWFMSSVDDLFNMYSFEVRMVLGALQDAFPHEAKDLVMHLDTGQKQDAKLWSINLTELMWHTKHELPEGMIGHDLDRTTKIESLRQSFVQSSTDGVRVLTEAIGISSVAAIGSSNSERFHDNLVASFEIEDDRFSLLLATNGGWATETDPGVVDVAYSHGSFGFDLSCDPEVGFDLRVFQEDLQVDHGMIRVPETGEIVDFPGVKPISFRAGMSLVPAVESDERQLRQLPQRLMKDSGIAMSELLSIPWLLGLQELRIEAMGAELDADAEIAFSLNEPPSYAGTAAISLQGLPTLYSALDATLNGNREDVLEGEARRMLKALEYMSSGEDLSDLEFRLEIDSAGMTMLNGRPFDQFLEEAMDAVVK